MSFFSSSKFVFATSCCIQTHSQIKKWSRVSYFRHTHVKRVNVREINDWGNVKYGETSSVDLTFRRLMTFLYFLQFCTPALWCNKSFFLCKIVNNTVLGRRWTLKILKNDTKKPVDSPFQGRWAGRGCRPCWPRCPGRRVSPADLGRPSPSGSPRNH